MENKNLSQFLKFLGIKNDEQFYMKIHFTTTKFATAELRVSQKYLLTEKVANVLKYNVVSMSIIRSPDGKEFRLFELHTDR